MISYEELRKTFIELKIKIHKDHFDHLVMILFDDSRDLDNLPFYVIHQEFAQ